MEIDRNKTVIQQVDSEPTETTKLIEEDDEGFQSIERYTKGSGEVNNSDLDVLYTFWIMKARQWERVHKGSYTRPRSFSFGWLVFFMLIYTGYLILQIVHFHRVDGWILEFILMGMMSISISIAFSRFGWFFRFMMFEIYSFFVVFFIMNLYFEPSKYVPLVIITAGAIIGTFLIFVVYPYILHCYLESVGSVVPHLASKDGSVPLKGTSPDQVRIEFDQTGCCTNTRTECIYQGPVRDGKPHGFGIWIDTSPQGEFLQGWWEEGIPRGPFESMENGTRSLLVNLRIFFATDAGGKFWLERVPLSMGVASVECCVSGNFFKSFPRVEMVSKAEECQCETKKCKCVGSLLRGKNYKHIDDEKDLKSVVVSVDRNGLTVTGFKAQKENHDHVVISVVKERGIKKLTLDEQWLSSNETEALLFIHGYDHNLQDSLKRFGQFLALGHFPSYLKPFVFNWPSATNPLFYWCAHSVASDNDIHRDLKKFLISLKLAGIKQLHIMCHSMGTRFFLRSWASIKNVFDVRFQSPSSSYADLLQVEKNEISRGLHLQNLIFLNPDYELSTFKNDYLDLRSYTSRITIYADHRDAAIKLAFQMTNKPLLGNNVNPLYDHRGNFIDIDLIDTSDLDRNTNSSFHSFFNVNRLMVDDLWELIVTAKRAGERNSRLKKTGDVYRFTILPSSVNMV